MADANLSRQIEEALRTSEARFRAIVMADVDVVYRMSPDWAVMQPLDGMGVLAGGREPDLGWLMDHIPGDERARVAAEIEAAIQAKGAFDLEHRVIRADGTVGWTLSRAVPLLDEAGEIAEWIGSAKDVTERKRDEETLREREARSTFLLKLSDALRPLQEPSRIKDEAMRVLGAHLGASGARFYEADDGGAPADADPGDAEGMPAAGRGRMGDFGPHVRDAFDAGRTVAVGDASSDARVGEADLTGRHALGFRAFMGIPLVRDGRAVGAVGVYRSAAHDWTGAEIALAEEAADRIWAAVERARAEAALRASEEQFRGFVENSADVLWIANRGGTRLKYLSPAFERIFGTSRDRVMMDITHWRDLVQPEDRATVAAFMARVVAGEVAIAHYRVVRPADGHIVHLRDTGFPITGKGAVVRIAGVVQDVTDIHRATAALEAEKERFRVLAEGIPQLVWRSGDDGLWTWSSPQWQAFTGQSQGDSHGWGWLDAIHPDDREATMRAWHEARPHGKLDTEYRVRRAGDGAWRWHQTRSVPVRGAPAPNEPEGPILEWLGTSTDVDDLRTLQDRQTVMVAELQHRTRNLIAVVQGIANDTMEHTGPTEAFRDAFADRLSALSRVQGLLSRSEAEPITIGTLVRLELDALGGGAPGDRVTVDGPEVFLRPSTVQTLALALHELATNARKYGALSHERGHLAVTWRERDAGDGHRLALDWVETGRERAPERPASAKVGGYGRELIERALPHALGAQTSYALTASGVRCMIDMPVRSGHGGMGHDDDSCEVDR